MRSIANQAYIATEIGAQGVMRHDPALGENLEIFQNVLLDAQLMMKDGKIQILEVHHENQSASRFVDYIRFVHMK